MEAPSVEFSQLAMQELSLDGVKRRYVRAVYFWAGCSVTKAAKILKVDRNTVYGYLGRDVNVGVERRKMEAGT
ncbi:MAG TPA: IS630 transposase-related protein [Polyangiaceae bacterium]|nr:IS630 transposase-related protein [Polyangiaceae bacterium]